MLSFNKIRSHLASGAVISDTRCLTPRLRCLPPGHQLFIFSSSRRRYFSHYLRRLLLTRIGAGWCRFHDSCWRLGRADSWVHSRIGIIYIPFDVHGKHRMPFVCVGVHKSAIFNRKWSYQGHPSCCVLLQMLLLLLTVLRIDNISDSFPCSISLLLQWFSKNVWLDKSMGLIHVNKFQIVAGDLHPRVPQDVPSSDPLFRFFMEQFLLEKPSWRWHMVWEYQFITSDSVESSLSLAPLKGNLPQSKAKIGHLGPRYPQVGPNTRPWQRFLAPCTKACHRKV